MLEDLKNEVCEANKRLVASGLIVLTWGNVSGYDAEDGLIVIKPSGVAYEDLTASDMVVVDMKGRVVEGRLRPSSDTPTHLELYRHFPSIRGIVHTHSTEATAWAQAKREVPCYGTTHADHAHGPVPVTRELTRAEVDEAYEVNTGKVIVERFATLSPDAVPFVLVAGHGPFAWGDSVRRAVDNAVALEAVAKMARLTEQIDSKAGVLPQYVLDKHYFRKHGKNAYYGQVK